MSEPIKPLVQRPVHGFNLYAVRSDATPQRLVRYEISLPSGGVLPFPPDALPAALKTFHAATDVWYWFSLHHRLYPIFEADDSNVVTHYAISGPKGEVFQSSGLPGGLVEALSVFERITGIDVTAADAKLGEPDRPKG